MNGKTWLSGVLNGQWPEGPDAYGLVINFADDLSAIHAACWVFSYTFGVYFTLKSIIRLARYGEGAQCGEVSGHSVIFMFVIAWLMFYLPTTLDTISFTAFGDTGNPFAYPVDPDLSLRVSSALAVIYRFIGVGGIIAAIYGLFCWKATSEGRSRSGFSKGSWHLIGGWCAMHLGDIQQVLHLSFSQ